MFLGIFSTLAVLFASMPTTLPQSNDHIKDPSGRFKESHNIVAQGSGPPAFDSDATTNVTVSASETANLPCVVHNLGQSTVAWIRKRDLYILTVGKFTYSSDNRFQVAPQGSKEDWTLTIQNANEGDSGEYECQVSLEASTGRFLSRTVRLSVVGDVSAHSSKATATPISYPNRGIGLQMMDSSYMRGGETPHRGDSGSSGDDEGTTDGANVALLPLQRAFNWTLETRTPEWGFGLDTPHTVLALALANPKFFPSRSHEAQLIAKEFELQLVLKLWKDRNDFLTAGRVALNVMALLGLCRDPRDFHSKNLVANLKRQPSKVYFEEAYTLMGSCVAGDHVRRSKIRKVLNIMLEEEDKQHSVDTLSACILALECVRRQGRSHLEQSLNEAMSQLIQKQGEDGSFGGNLHSTAIALQAIIARGLEASWNATRAQQYVLSHQRPDGSFGSQFDTNAVLPLLGGNTFLTIAEVPCVSNVHLTDEGGHSSPSDLPLPSSASGSDGAGVSAEKTPEMITFQYIIWIGNDATFQTNLTMTVPKNTTFYEVMKIAAEMDEHYEFSATKFSTGYYIHTLAGQKEQDPGYWYWLLFRMREPPVPGTKPDNKYITPVGVAEFIPDDGDYVLFWYHQI